MSRIRTAARDRPTAPADGVATAPALAVDVPARLAEVDEAKMHADRLAKVRAELRPPRLRRAPC